jgi:hypothetical protein
MQRKYHYVWDKAVHKWMWSRIEKSLLAYIPWLQEIEHGLYDGDSTLLHARLKERVCHGAWPVFPEYLRDSVHSSSFLEGSFAIENNSICATSTRLGQSKNET